MNSSDDEGVAFELPDPPQYLPKAQPHWTAMSTSSTRFAVTAMRKSTKNALFRCRKLVSTSKEIERLESELDRIARQTKNDMSLAKVPKALLKDRRIAALEDVKRTLEQLHKKLKVSLFMESYLGDERDRRKTEVHDLDVKLNAAKEQVLTLEGPMHPSLFEMATRANRGCPSNFARPRLPIAQDARRLSSASVFLYNCRMLSDSS
jgi:hypothetical protein